MRKISQIILIVLYLTGTVGLSISYTRPYFVPLTWITLTISFVLLLLNHQKWALKTVLAFILIYLLSFGIEAIGTSTGFPFGLYTYPYILGPQFLNTPLIIGINWLMLLYIISATLANFKLPKILSFFGTAILMTGMDIIIEGPAQKLNYWHWTQGKPPIQNYISWFLVSLILLMVLDIMKIKIKNKVAGILLLLQILFFAILNLTL